MENLLKELKIDKVISIDDSWGIKDEVLNIDILEYNAQHQISLNEQIEEDIIEKELKTLKDLKEHLGEEEFNKLYKIEDVEKDEALKNLKEVFNSNLINFNSIDDFKKNDLKISSEEFILFIIDINMGSGKEDSIIELLDVIEKSYRRFSVVIYSHERSIIEKLNDLNARKEYLNEKNKDIRYMALIHTVSKSEENLKKELMEKILYSSLYVGLHNFLETKKNLDDKIYKSIYNSELYSFDRSVLRTLEDGESVIDLMRKLFLIGHHCNFASDSEFMEVRKKFIEISNCYKSRNENIIVDLDVNEKSKYSIIDYSVNDSFKDIYTGDIFRLEIDKKERYGIVITRSCDMIIRKERSGAGNIKRSVQNGKVMLLLFEKIEVKKNKCTDEKLSSGEWIFPYSIGAENKVEILNNLKKHIFIDDFLLDLCSLNKNGKIKYSFSKNIFEGLNFKSYHSHSYFKKFLLKDKLDQDLRKALIEFSGKVEEKLTLEEEKFILKSQIENLKKNNNNLKIDLENNELKIELERVGRLQEDKALAVYQYYMFNMSKRGVDTVL